ncbi:hypothetical protein TNCV_1152511 [Trichonephila clavipes]|nr:hypothetical protein TNCV_1152511 [Trichonephila clavipes]
MVKVSDRGSHVTSSSPVPTKDQSCRGMMHVKSIVSSNVLPLVCGCGKKKASYGWHHETKTKRKLDDAGASEINRLYPELRRKVEKERPISEFTPPPQGEAGGRERPTMTKLE